MSDEFDLARLRAAMRALGVRRLYVKPLAPNDNSKNQVYLGPGFEVLNILPNKGVVRDGEKPIFKARLTFSWMTRDGRRSDAPGAQLILYPQYPEVRLSGFLRSSELAPSELMSSRQAGRLLFLGVTEGAAVVAFVAAPDSELARSAGSLSPPTTGVLTEISMEPGEGADSKILLIRELRRVHLLGWIRSKRLRGDGTTTRCEAPNCGGYTLEAELGVRPNGFSEPDFHGWEVKQHGVGHFGAGLSGAITLLTPEPTGGYYRSEGPSNFIERFGYADKRGRENRWNFGGIHRATGRHAGTGLALVLTGYDATKNVIAEPSGGIALMSESGELAALWGYEGLIAHWTRKHARAVFVPSITKKEPSRQYAYGSSVRLAEGTDFFRFLRAVRDGLVYYDPGLKLVPNEKLTVKRRNQFRVRSSDIGGLYNSVTETNLLK